MPRIYATPDRSASENVTPWRNGFPYTEDRAEGDDPPMPTDQETEVARRRAEFRAVLRHRVIDEMGIAEDKAVTFVSDGLGIRWQTVQGWFLGASFPLGKNLIALAKFLKIPEYHLVPPMVDVDPPAAFLAFMATPEGASMTDMERWAVRLFPWAQGPNLGDYRQLLALYRANAER